MVFGGGAESVPDQEIHVEPTSTTAFAGSEAHAREELRAERLSELVMHLTGCSAEAAHHAVEGAAGRSDEGGRDALEVVARALVSIRRGALDLRQSS